MVRVTQQLDPHLDPASFAFGEYGWGSHRFQAPVGVTSFRERYDLLDEIGLFVDVEAVFDPDTATLVWTFTAIDPRTMQIPDDKGFLPVNLADHVGDGFVSYTVRARDTVQNGDVIYAQAKIVFDDNEPISTPLIFNTIGPVVPDALAEGSRAGSPVLAAETAALGPVVDYPAHPSAFGLLTGTGDGPPFLLAPDFKSDLRRDAESPFPTLPEYRSETPRTIPTPFLYRSDELAKNKIWGAAREDGLIRESSSGSDEWLEVRIDVDSLPDQRVART